jgi:Histidine kinase-, DNA gyrase B-, and HSP90-like ATPase
MAWAKSSQTAPRKAKSTDHGKLKIGDDWNAIRIIALSQSNPLKAIAEFVENSIDANAKTITITRGREHGEHYLSVSDDGEGVPRDGDGRPNFKYVATHICDSIKRRLKAEEGRGTELRISPLLEGVRALSGEKIQWYLASELRDRIRSAKVRVTVVDRLARKHFEVEPRAYEGRLLHQLPAI